MGSAEELGRAIASIANQSNDIREDVLPDDINQELLLVPNDVAEFTTLVTGTRRSYATDSFILDHPVYGELDSSTLKIDGGYSADGAIDYVGGAFAYPGTYSAG